MSASHPYSKWSCERSEVKDLEKKYFDAAEAAYNLSHNETGAAGAEFRAALAAAKKTEVVGLQKKLSVTLRASFQKREASLAAAMAEMKAAREALPPLTTCSCNGKKY